MEVRMVDQIRVIDFTDGEPTIGMGFNSTTLQFPGTALTFTEAPPDPHESGQIVNAHAVIINSHEELMESIGTSIGVSGRYGLSSASAKVDFSKSTGYNSTSTFVLAKASVVNPIVRGVNFRLTDVAAQLNHPNTLDAFKGAFGDSFVRGIKTGGEFFAVFRLTAKRQTTQQSLAVAVAADINGITAQGGFNAKFGTASQSEQDSAEVEVSFYQAAGSGATASVTLEVNEILQRLKNFPTIARDAPMPYKVEIATYDTIPILGPTPQELDDFRNSLQQDEATKLDYITRKNDVDFALSHPEFFDDLPDATVLHKDSGLYVQLINAVMAHLEDLAKGKFEHAEIFDPAKVNIPVPQEIIFKRKQEVAVDLGIFEGTWENTNPQHDLIKMIIIKTDATHVSVRGTYQGAFVFPGEKVSTAEFDDNLKALKGSVSVGGFVDIPEGKFDFLFSSYEITNPPNAAQTLVVTNSQRGSVGVIVGETQTDTFRRSGA
jgi:hypothetical protein